MAGGLDALRGRLAEAMTARGFGAQAAALERLAARSEGPDTVLPVLPVLAHLDGAVARAGEEVDADLAAVLGPLAAAARWQQTAAYVASPPDPSFLDLYAHATLADAEDVALGLVLLGPGVRYPPHHHPAEEFYLPAGVIRWVHAAAADPAPEPAGVLVHHGSWQPHGMWTGERAVLLVYVWIGEVGTSAAFC
ncbi:dimethylsulfonioproprionate lyase family protein [Actinomycetospora callitridis]|uniref:dimethylsulfonioproprionate lyase family protein n=1 Tax=Actinomycetospora callitridis TaxID=913944 RepID=UPI002366F2C9|nr:dimethylsulfonioproprionate lyase family protein [Actinomycetospora callitridis]MDD7919467.1 dimethylsulfonioproprionate lyase family protein [Actinomycetospora callitridis]